MNGNRRWLGWIGIALGALALLVALFGRGFSWQGATAQWGGAAPQSSVQAGAGQPNTGAQPGANDQPGMRQQGRGPQQDGQQGMGPRQGGPQQGGQQGMGPQRGPGAPDMGGRRGPGGAGFLSGLLRFPAMLARQAFQVSMLALLILAGLWLIRRRAPASASATAARGPAPEPPSPTGEAYIEEPEDES